MTKHYNQMTKEELADEYGELISKYDRIGKKIEQIEMIMAENGMFEELPPNF